MKSITQNEIFESLGVSCSQGDQIPDKMCAKDILNAFKGVPRVETSDIQNIIHNLGGSHGDDAMIDPIKFFEAC